MSEGKMIVCHSIFNGWIGGMMGKREKGIRIRG